MPSAFLPSETAPTGYAAAVQAVDFSAVRADITSMLTDSKDSWPADYGNYGPLFVPGEKDVGGSGGSPPERPEPPGAFLLTSTQRYSAYGVSRVLFSTLLTPLAEKSALSQVDSARVALYWLLPVYRWPRRLRRRTAALRPRAQLGRQHKPRQGPGSPLAYQKEVRPGVELGRSIRSCWQHGNRIHERTHHWVLRRSH
jgi:hypothetical protein